jgi:Flp pilus assembly protein TadD
MSHLGDHCHLGTALLKKGDLEGAIVECRAALRLSPNEAGPATTLQSHCRRKVIWCLHGRNTKKPSS